MCVADASLAKRMGVPRELLVDPALEITVANNAGLEIVGAGFVTLTTKEGTSTQEMVYFAKGVGEFYLSQDACEGLGIIPKDFPRLRSGVKIVPAPRLGALGERGKRHAADDTAQQGLGERVLQEQQGPGKQIANVCQVQDGVEAVRARVPAVE